MSFGNNHIYEMFSCFSMVDSVLVRFGLALYDNVYLSVHNSYGI